MGELLGTGLACRFPACGWGDAAACRLFVPFAPHPLLATSPTPPSPGFPWLIGFLGSVLCDVALNEEEPQQAPPQQTKAKSTCLPCDQMGGCCDRMGGCCDRMGGCDFIRTAIWPQAPRPVAGLGSAAPKEHKK